MNFDDYNFDDESKPTKPANGFMRNKTVICVVTGLAGIVAGVILLAPKKSSAAQRKPMDAVVAIAALPPPPPVVQPPPPPPEPKQEEEMEKQDELVEEEQAPEEASDDSPELSSVAGPPGNDNFGLSGRRGGSGVKKVVGSRNKGRFNDYALSLRNTLVDALRRHPKTQRATMVLQIKIWADQSGRITRTMLTSSSGDPEVDAALRGNALVGMQLHAPPPSDMKMPINLQVTAKRPG